MKEAPVYRAVKEIVSSCGGAASPRGSSVDWLHSDLTELKYASQSRFPG